MDTSAYLTRHGWQGAGHSLHPSGRGIKKPLLTSRKTNLLGLGKKKNDVHADQWWARAFDNSLKSLEVTKIKSPSTIDHAAATHQGSLEIPSTTEGKWAGLYDGFVRGESLKGTIAFEDLCKDSCPEQVRATPGNGHCQIHVPIIREQITEERKVDDCGHSSSRNRKRAKGSRKRRVKEVEV